jgi:dethiobiotin synthetase
MRVVFVTGTDTDVGKTVVTAALAVSEQAAGGSPYVLKPAQTGVGPGDPGDLDVVRRLAGPLPGSEGVRLREPLAPDAAARLEGATLPGIREQRDRILEAAGDPVIVEGAGGILVPLGQDWTLLDLAAAVRFTGADVSFVVVARAGLGTLNHSGLTVQAIAARGLYVEGVVIGSWPEEPDLATTENLHDLPRTTGVPVLGSVPAGAGSWDSDRFRAAAAGWFARE